jgi:hypothetical protein
VTTPAEGFTLEDVLREERDFLRGPADKDAPPKTQGAPSHPDEFLGLAFSGGGIRSATFNLGVLQALSELKLLKEFDYLSTVSGGGYIGSWLSAWIHRAGIDTVEQQLNMKDHPHEEPKEVTFLRSYSNYLTPRTGIFSTDTLAAVATYLRNLILNLSVVLLCLTVALLLPRLFAWAGQGLQAWPNVLLAVAGLGLAVAVLFINLNLASQLPYSQTNRDKMSQGSKWKAPRYATRTAVVAWIVVPLTLAALALSYWLAGPAPPLRQVLLETDWPTLRRDVWIVALMTFTIGFFWFCALKIARVWREPGDRPTWRWRLGALVIGVLIGLVGLVAFQEIMFAKTDPGVSRLWWATVCGLPGLLGVFGLAVVFVIGVSGRQFEEDSREWWSRLGGVLFGIAVGWLVVAGLAVYAPPWVMRVTRLAQGLSVAWLVTTVAGVRAAMSGSSGKPGSVSWRDRLAMITPYVFLAGLLIALAFGIHAALAAWHGESTFTFEGNDYFSDISKWLTLGGLGAPFLFNAALAAFFSWRIDVNVFAFHMFYRNRLVRCYLGASNPHRANHPFTGFDGGDSVPMKDLRQRPYHLVNAALNITRGTRLAWQERKAASFVASPIFCGYELKAEDGTAAAGTYQRTEQYLADENEARKRRRTRAWTRRNRSVTDDPDPGELKLGLGPALAVSGAAASPNQGYHSSPAVAFLMTVFNVRLGWWLQNPAQLRQWRHMGPRWGIMYLLSELLGMADDSSKYVYLSDGGHFENLGIYELVRRRCRFIVACDASMDPGFEFEDLGSAIRKCQVDLGVSIEIDTRPIRPDPATQRSLVHCAVGTIRYGRAGKPAADGKHEADGYLLYIKPSITGSEPGDVLQYGTAHAEFPHESTSDQWFGESQFESYRKLGHHIARLVFRGAGISARRGQAAPERPGRERMFVALKERWYPSSAAVKAGFSRHADRLNTLQVALRRDDSLRFLDAQIYPEWDELMRGREAPHRSSLSLPSSASEARAGFYFCINLLELMQSVYLDLNLEEEHDHPDNRGWMNLFKHWSWATMLRATYAICCSTFGARFQTFCARRLELAPGVPRVVSHRVDGSVSGILDEARRQKELNFFELKLVQACESDGLPFDEVHLLRLRVDDPSRSTADPDAEPALEFTFGFALTHQREFVYFRVQDHLRRMGLARDALRRLCELRYTEVSKQAREDADPEGWRRFRALLTSALSEIGGPSSSPRG